MAQRLQALLPAHLDQCDEHLVANVRSRVSHQARQSFAFLRAAACAVGKLLNGLLANLGVRALQIRRLRRQNAAKRLDLIKIVPGFRFHLVGQFFNIIAAAQRVHRIGRPAFVGNNLLGAQRHPHRRRPQVQRRGDQALYAYVAGRWSDDIVSALFLRFMTSGVSRAFEQVLGLEAQELYADFHAALAAASDAVIIYATKTGIELTARGIPVKDDTSLPAALYAFRRDPAGPAPETIAPHPLDGTDEVTDLAVQPDGKIVAAGHYAGALARFLVARFNPDGSFEFAFTFATLPNLNFNDTRVRKQAADYVQFWLDRGIDGYLHFRDADRQPQFAVISVKGGGIKSGAGDATSTSDAGKSGAGSSNGSGSSGSGSKSGAGASSSFAVS